VGGKESDDTNSKIYISNQKIVANTDVIEIDNESELEGIPEGVSFIELQS